MFSSPVSYCTCHGSDFTTRASNILVDIEAFPEMINRSMARLSTDVDKYTHMWLDKWAKGLKEPSVRVNLLLVLFLQTEEHLSRHDALFGAPEVHVGVNGYLRGVLLLRRRRGGVINLRLAMHERADIFHVPHRCEL